MAKHAGQSSLLVVALLGLSLFGGVANAGVLLADVRTGGKAVTKTSGQTTTARSSVSAKSLGGKVSVSGTVTAKDGASSELNIAATARDNASVNVVGEANAVDEGAVAIVNAVLEAAGDADLKAGVFANAIQLGDGPVIAKALLRAKATGDEAYNEATSAFALSIATAIGKGPENAATIATTIASVVAEEGEARVALGKSLSVLIADKGCGPIQDVIQKAEAEASSKGNQRAFLEAINVDVKLITCAFPDTCGTDGVDKRGGCCGDDKAEKSGKCGACKDNICDFRLIWGNPSKIWACDAADCKNKKPCICG